MVDELQDSRRVEVPYTSTEREGLDAWLEWHRTTLLLKCEGLDDAGRRARPVPTSLLSLHGLVRHMAEVERGWFQRTLEGREVGGLFFTDEHPDGDLELLHGANWEADLVTWQQACEESRVIAAAHDLDDTGLRRGRAVSLRWIMTHMIEEYARHNGHADLIREMVDGSVGD